MYISELKDIKVPKIIIVSSKSELVLESFLRYVNRIYGINERAVQKPANMEELTASYTLGYTVPLGLKRWMFNINQDKVFINKSMLEQLETTTTATYMISTADFRTLNILRGMTKYTKECVEISLNYLGKDLINVISKDILGVKLDDSDIDYNLRYYLTTGYKLYPEKFYLALQAHKRTPLTSKREIIDLIGPPDNTQEMFVLSLLGMENTSETGYRIKVRNRMQAGLSLVEVKGIRSLRNFLIYTVKDILAIKTMMLNGRLYKKFALVDDITMKELKRYRKYEKHLSEINKIPVSRVLTLLSALSSTSNWYSELDFMEFLYEYLYKIK